MELAPNQTLYVSNLNDRLRKHDLRKHLFFLFSQYGKVIDVVALKTEKMRGQAHVVFSDVPQATRALRELNGMTFFGKPMRVQFARGKSHAVAKLDGTFVPPSMRKQEPETEQKAPNEVHTAAASTAVGGANLVTDVAEEGAMQDDAAPVGSEAPISAINNPPSNILMVQDLAPSTELDTVTRAFAPFPGFQQVRLMPGTGAAFVDFDTEHSATTARDSLAGFPIDGHNVKIGFARTE
ncbi:MAG: hypothetical protein MHM6MM_001732 [Cercozoa sp. M6MM]